MLSVHNPVLRGQTSRVGCTYEIYVMLFNLLTLKIDINFLADDVEVCIDRSHETLKILSSCDFLR